MNILTASSMTKGRQNLASKMFVACLLLLMAATNSVVVADEPVVDEPVLEVNEVALCRTLNSCSDCLNVGFCDWYGSICSHNTLQIADITRYSVDPQSTVEEVCERATLDREDRDICDSKMDCSSCTETILSDSFSSCTWYPQFGVCAPEVCGLAGCGVSTCDETGAENASVASTSNKGIGMMVFAILSVALAL